MRYPYLWLDLLTLLGPLALSFDRRVAYAQQWRYLVVGLVPAAALFLGWDVWFSAAGYWAFNDAYLLGVRWLGLPLEEWLFFMVVPYATVFVYDCLWRYLPRSRMGPTSTDRVTLALIFLFLLIAVWNYHRWYTTLTFGLLAAALAGHRLWLGRAFLPHIYAGWLVCQVPFFLVNGVLTALPVVTYNNQENLGIRIYTVPVEDIFYGFLLYLLTITGMEAARRRPVGAAVRSGTP